jgi:hypothetical protein
MKATLTKKEIIKKTKWCSVCGIYPVAEYHHIVWKSQGGTDNPENIVGLCELCHDRAPYHEDTDVEKMLFENYKNSGGPLVEFFSIGYHMTERYRSKLDQIKDPIQKDKWLINKLREEIRPYLALNHYFRIDL